MSPRQICDAMKAIPKTPKSTNSTMMVALFHGYVIPPSWMASSRHTRHGAIRMNPRGSSSKNLPFHVLDLFIGGSQFGVSMASSSTETPPTGRLIQKHHRQLTDVRKPPSIGPRIEEMPKTDPSEPMYFGLDCIGTRKLMRMKHPGGIAAAPIPVITLPTIKAFEEGAVAQTREPISKIATLMTSTHFVE